MNNVQTENPLTRPNDTGQGFIHCSLYTVLINSNRSPDPGSAEEQYLTENLRASFNHTFNQPQLYIDQMSGAEMDPGWITRLQVVAGAAERGRNRNRLHFHGTVRAEHYGIMQLDYREMHRVFREWWQNQGGDYTPFLNVRFVRDSACARLLYADKENNPLKDMFDVLRGEERQLADAEGRRLDYERLSGGSDYVSPYEQNKYAGVINNVAVDRYA